MKPRFIISDLHLGDGCQSRLEDFDHRAAEHFISFFDAVASIGGAKVIINGDFIDFPQVILPQMTPPPSRFLGTTEQESLERLERVLTGHAPEFEAMKRFLTTPGNELLMTIGNHDVDLSWNRVIARLKRRIGATDDNFRFGMAYKETGLYVTHGHQYSDDNKIDLPVNLTFNRLNSCWGTRFVEDFFNSVEERYPLLDNARPMWKVALSAILHEELLVTGRFAAELLMFLKSFGLPLKDWMTSAIIGWRPDSRTRRVRNIEAVTSDIYVDELRDKIQELRTDPQFRQDFDAVLYELNETQWERMMSRAEPVETRVKHSLHDSELQVTSRSLFSKGDNYQQAAEVIAQHHPDVRTVVMGHTHYGLDSTTLDVPNKEWECEYLNSGTWTRTYDIPWWKLPRLNKLDDPKLFRTSSGVVRCLGAHETLRVEYFDTWEDALRS